MAVTSSERLKLVQSIIGLILKDPCNLMQCFKQGIQKEWLETKTDENEVSLSLVYEKIIEFYKAHKAVPTTKVLLMELGTKRTTKHLYKIALKQCRQCAKKDTQDMVEPYVEKIAEYYRRTCILNSIRETVESDAEGTFQSTQDMSNAIISKVVQIQQTKQSFNQVMLTSDSMRQTLEVLRQRPHPPIPTGWLDMDEVLEGGWFPGTISTIAGRPGMGKTIFLLNSATAAAKMGVPTLFIGAELPNTELNYRQLSLASDAIPYNKMFRGYNPKDPKCLSKKDMKEIEAVTNLYDGIPLYIVNALGMDIQTICNTIIEQVMIHGVKIVFLDYFQRICIKHKNMGVRRANSSHEFTDISNKLLHTTVYCNIPLVQGSQLNRECEKRKGFDRRPRIGDLKDSGCIEEDSHRVIGLFRDEFYNPTESTKPGMLEVQILKNRSGNNPILEYAFNGKRGLISTIAKRNGE